MRWGIAVALFGACTFSGPGGSESDPESPELPPDVDVLTMTGTIVDFVTGQPVTDVTLEGVDLSDGEISVTGSSFTVSGVLPYSIFRVRASSPTHETTISALLEIGEQDVTDAVVEVVPPALIDDAYSTTGRSRSDGLIIARLIDGSSGDPMAGVSRDAFPVGDVIRFLDGAGAVSGDAPISLDPGVALLMNVDPGLVALDSQVSEHIFIAPQVRVEDSVVTLADIDVALEPPPLPMDVTFNQVVGVFADRGCMICHRTGIIWNPPAGFDLLSGNNDDRYAAVMDGRVDLADIYNSLLLRKPSFEEAEDGHQIVFENQYDPDRMIIESWLLDGAQR